MNERTREERERRDVRDSEATRRDASSVAVRHDGSIAAADELPQFTNRSVLSALPYRGSNCRHVGARES